MGGGPVDSDGPARDPSPSLVGDIAPEVASGVLATSLAILGAAIVLLVVVMVWAHVARVTRHRRFDRILRTVRPRLMALAADEPPSDDLGHRRLTGFRARVVDGAVLDLLAKVRGGATAALVRVLEDNGAVEEAIRGARSRSATRRARSARVLGATRDREYAPLLARLLVDRDRAVRTTAARALGVLGDPDYADVVLRSVRRRGATGGIPFYVVADALLGMGSDVREAIRRGLDDPDPGVRLVAATVASRGGMATVVPRIRQLLRGDPDARVRIAAAHALGAIGGADAIDDLAHAVEPGQPATLRSAAAQALGEIGAPAGVPLLQALLGGRDRALAVVAARSLAALGARGESTLVEVLTAPDAVPDDLSVRDIDHVPPVDLAALAALGAVTELGIRDRRDDLYALATLRRTTS